MAILSPGLAPRAIRPRAMLLVAWLASPQLMTRSPWMKAGASGGTASATASRISPKFESIGLNVPRMAAPASDALGAKSNMRAAGSRLCGHDVAAPEPGAGFREACCLSWPQNPVGGTRLGLQGHHLRRRRPAGRHHAEPAGLSQR